MIVLASASPRRLELLHALGLSNIVVCPADIDETPRVKEKPPSYVLRLAEEKAAAIAPQYPGHYILGADTIVAVGTRILGKAETPEEALAQLTLISGRRHRVYTGVCLITPKGDRATRLAMTHVALKRLSQQELKAYVESEEWKGVAVYRSQGKMAAFIRSITGTPSNILGLPLYDVSQLLQGKGYPLFSPHLGSVVEK